MRSAALLLVLCLVGCAPDKAEVQCQSSGEVMTCTVKHTSGSNVLGVCFEMKLSCANGVVSTAKACQDVSPGQTSNRIFRDEDFTNVDKCDKVINSAMGQVVVSRK